MPLISNPDSREVDTGKSEKSLMEIKPEITERVQKKTREGYGKKDGNREKKDQNPM